MIHPLRRFLVGSTVLSVVAIAPLVTASTAFAAGNDPAQGTEALATLKVTSTKVEVKKDGAEKFKVAKDGATLRQGDTVRTDATGLAEIDYDDESYTRLDVNTTFTIKKLTHDQGDRQVQGSLDTGQTWSRTSALTESGSFEEEGAGANATTRGTAFAVTCDTAEHCTFTAVVHIIDVTGRDGQTHALNPLQQCDSSSPTPNVQQTGDLCGEVSTLTPDEFAAFQWIQDNLARDKSERGIDDAPVPFVGVKGTLVIENGQFVSFTPDVTPPGFTPPPFTPPPFTPPGGTPPPPGGTPPPNTEFAPPTFEFAPPVINDPPIFCLVSCSSPTAVGPGAFEVTVPDGYVGGNHLYVEDEESVSFIVNGTPGASGEFSVVFITVPDPIVGNLYYTDGESSVLVVTQTPYDPATTFTFQADFLAVEEDEPPLDTSFSFVAVSSSGQTSDVATVDVTVMEDPCEYGCGGD